MEVGARDVQGLPHLAQPAPRQSYAPTAGKTHALQPWAPIPMESGTCQTDLSVEKKGKRDGGKRMIQRLNEENGHQEILCGGDASKAGRAWAKWLTADHAHDPCC